MNLWLRLILEALIFSDRSLTLFIRKRMGK
jgi:hypothetical protein